MEQVRVNYIGSKPVQAGDTGANRMEWDIGLSRFVGIPFVGTAYLTVPAIDTPEGWTKATQAPKTGRIRNFLQHPTFNARIIT